VRRGLAASRENARALVHEGAVLVGGSLADKPARLVAASEPVVVIDTAARRFVSRGGEKLAAGLDRFGLAVTGRRCLDAGASTGGFTDCLLQRGASVVVDVGHGQLDATLRRDPRVLVMERTNVRTLGPAVVGGEVFDLLVADLSFISLVTVAPVLARDLAAPGADIVVLVKPQFEAGRRDVSRGKGVIRSAATRRAALERVASAFSSQGATIIGAMASPLLGPAGNAEFLLHSRAHGVPGSAPIPPSDALGAMLDAAVRAAPDEPGPSHASPDATLAPEDR
jgi:23S rRNA (cytidine1920-2'-O)/16S rRNA (cytidine1409-2'-O)-methyltransferase